MRVGRVIGKVVLSERHPDLPQGRLLVVNPLDLEGFRSPQTPALSAEPSLVVFDNLGTGAGDLIGFAEGGEAMNPFSKPVPIDATSAAIIDNLHYNPLS